MAEVTKLKTSPAVKDMQTTISTMRLLIAAMINRFGVFGQVTLTAAEIQAVQSGDLSIFDNPQGDIVLQIKGAPPKLVIHG